MQLKEKISLMDKVLRELDDVINSQTSVLKKIAQIEADNINLNDSALMEGLPDIHEHVDEALTATTDLKEKFQVVHDQFVADNPLTEVP